jgi:hypothetical protein
MVRTSGDGYWVETDELRAHADNVQAVAGQFDAVRSASGHISQDDTAYGYLCGWISAVLEGRHTRQDELLGSVKENLVLVAENLTATATSYDEADRDAAAGLDPRQTRRPGDSTTGEAATGSAP